MIVSLPSPWTDAYRVLRTGPYRESLAIKYYGLPPTPPGDRHKWFFSASEARAFVGARALHNGYEVIEQRSEGGRPRFLRHPLRWACEWVLFRNGVGVADLYEGTQWFVLQRAKSDRAVAAYESA